MLLYAVEGHIHALKNYNKNVFYIQQYYTTVLPMAWNALPIALYLWLKTIESKTLISSICDVIISVISTY